MRRGLRGASSWCLLLISVWIASVASRLRTLSIFLGCHLKALLSGGGMLRSEFSPAVVAFFRQGLLSHCSPPRPLQPARSPQGPLGLCSFLSLSLSCLPFLHTSQPLTFVKTQLLTHCYEMFSDRCYNIFAQRAIGAACLAHPAHLSDHVDSWVGEVLDWEAVGDSLEGGVCHPLPVKPGARDFEFSLEQNEGIRLAF